MSIGDFRAPDLHYTGWLEKVKESNDIVITDPKDHELFYTDLGASKKKITVSGVAHYKTQEKVLVIIRTDRDYPQALGDPKKNGNFTFTGCTLGGVDHQVYAVLIDDNDIPLIRSNVVTVRLERKI